MCRIPKQLVQPFDDNNWKEPIVYDNVFSKIPHSEYIRVWPFGFWLSSGIPGYSHKQYEYFINWLDNQFKAKEIKFGPHHLSWNARMGYHYFRNGRMIRFSDPRDAFDFIMLYTE